MESKATKALNEICADLVKLNAKVEKHLDDVRGVKDKMDDLVKRNPIRASEVEAVMKGWVSAKEKTKEFHDAFKKFFNGVKKILDLSIGKLGYFKDPGQKGELKRWCTVTANIGMNVSRYEELISQIEKSHKKVPDNMKEIRGDAALVELKRTKILVANFLKEHR